MTTVKQLKDGAKISKPIYVSKPYVVIGDKMILSAGTLDEMKELSSYYDDCEVKAREHDLHEISNVRIVYGAA